MRGFTSILANFGLVASLALGTSGLAMDPSLHRRHALNVRDAVPEPAAAMMPRMEHIAERRSLRQKRCVQRNSNDSLTSPSTPATSTLVNAETAPVNVAPVPTPAQDPTTSTFEAPQSTTTEAVSNSPSSGGADTFTGQLTFYDVGLGACGQTNSNSDMIAAASMLLFDGFDGYTGGNPNSNPICNKQAVVTYQGKTITVTIVDRCVGCAHDDLDLSPTGFSQLADQGLGRLSGATWHFL